MTEFNTKPLEEKLSQFGRELQSFFENIIPDGGLDLFSPKADIIETSAGVEIHLDLPGLSKKDIRIELSDGVLTVKGAREISETKNQISWLRRERHHGRFSRSFPLPVNADKKGINAKFSDGVLVVTVKAEKDDENTTTIEIK